MTMSRLYTRNNRSRQPMLGSGTRTNKSKEQPSDTYYPPNTKKNKNTPKGGVIKAAASRNRAPSTSSSDLSSLAGFETGDEASDEDSEEEADDDDDEDDLPAVRTPSRSRTLNGAGPKRRLFGRDDVSLPGSVDSMFGDFANYYEEDDDPTLSPEENRKRFESHVFGESDDDNDDVYQAVDEISDSEDDMDDRQIEEQELLAMMSEEANSDADFLLNQIDGLSAYGFGDDSDASVQRYPSSQGSDSGFDAGLERHVHFAVDADPSIFLRMSESPTITRALLPSALPELNLNSRVAERRPVGLVDDLDDCMFYFDSYKHALTPDS